MVHVAVLADQIGRRADQDDAVTCAPLAAPARKKTSD